VDLFVRVEFQVFVNCPRAKSVAQIAELLSLSRARSARIFYIQHQAEVIAQNAAELKLIAIGAAGGAQRGAV
jgi:hypothetical protein